MGLGIALGVALDKIAIGVALGVVGGGFLNHRGKRKEISKGS